VRVLVTGGAGFIGSHVVDAMLAEGHDVAVLDNLSTGRRENVPAGVRLFEVDLRHREATAAAVTEFRPELVSHQAAQASVAISVQEPRLDADVNVMGGLNLLDACVLPGARVARIVFASTGGAIYGEVLEGKRASEETPADPQSPYAIHKWAFERLLAVYERHRGLAATTLRYANVYGPRQDPHGEAGVVAIFFGAALSGRRLRVNARAEVGDAGCVRDYVYVSDVAEANVLALTGKLREKTLNVASGRATTTRELAEAILGVTGQNSPLDAGPPRAGDLERSVLDPTRLLAQVKTGISLYEGLTRTHAFYAKNRG
jgi:UDP-glucose 4-epimerase